MEPVKSSKNHFLLVWTQNSLVVYTMCTFVLITIFLWGTVKSRAFPKSKKSLFDISLYLTSSPLIMPFISMLITRRSRTLVAEMFAHFSILSSLDLDWLSLNEKRSLFDILPDEVEQLSAIVCPFSFLFSSLLSQFHRENNFYVNPKCQHTTWDLIRARTYSRKACLYALGLQL